MGHARRKRNEKEKMTRLVAIGLALLGSLLVPISPVAAAPQALMSGARDAWRNGPGHAAAGAVDSPQAICRETGHGEDYACLTPRRLLWGSRASPRVRSSRNRVAQHGLCEIYPHRHGLAARLLFEEGERPYTYTWFKGVRTLAER